MENWRDIPSYEGLYQVSDLGNVRSVDRIVAASDGRNMHLKGRALVNQKHSEGYAFVVLSRGNVRKQALVHRLVLETFVGPCPADMEGCHGDGDRWNARLDNLRWDTSSNNHLDKAKHGTDIRGEKHHCAKLSEGQVIEIYRRANAGETYPSLAAEFGVQKMQVCRIKSGKTWGWLTQGC